MPELCAIDARQVSTLVPVSTCGSWQADSTITYPLPRAFRLGAVFITHKVSQKSPESINRHVERLAPQTISADSNHHLLLVLHLVCCISGVLHRKTSI